jgi:hypothetical protein
MTKPGLILACGCEVPYVDGETPQCGTHGIQRVVRTVRMPKPRIRGVATGPLVRTEDLPAFTGRLVGSDS